MYVVCYQRRCLNIMKVWGISSPKNGLPRLLSAGCGVDQWCHLVELVFAFAGWSFLALGRMRARTPGDGDLSDLMACVLFFILLVYSFPFSVKEKRNIWYISLFQFSYGNTKRVFCSKILKNVKV